MQTSPIAKIEITSESGVITCTTTPLQEQAGTEYAFYIYRNQERIHVEWYTDSNIFKFDTKGIPGCYWASGYVKIDDNNKCKVDSRKLFINHLEVSPETFGSSDEETISFALKGKNWTFPALYYPSEKQALFVLMPSAINRGKAQLPAFNRWTWASSGFFPGHSICISDPTLDLHDQLNIGWCLGDKDNCATAELSEFIIELAKSKGIPTEKIIIYGSSAGGFSALALASLIDGSTAIAINPQIDATAYEAIGQVELMSKTCFDMSKEDLRSTYTDRIDMKVRWESVKNSRAVIVQNITDEHHYNDHFKDFWTSLGGDPEAIGITRQGNHIAWIYSQEGGHVAETKEMALELFKELGL